MNPNKNRKDIEMKVIGITGGVGSGKSEVLRILEEDFQCGIIRTDDVARMLCEPGQSSYKKIVEYFGTEILDADGAIDRPKLASIVFKDDAKLLKLNEFTHPEVYLWVQNQVKEWKSSHTYAMIAVESALLEKLKEMSVCDIFWYIYVKPEIRRERLKASRDYSDAKIDEMFASQLDEQVFMDQCDAVIDNNRDLKHIEEQLKKLCERL